MTFYSIPGMGHANSGESDINLGSQTAGDTPVMVKRPVINPRTGEKLYDRVVYEPSFNPGLDGADSHFRGDRVEKVVDIHDRKNARTETIYKRFDASTNKYKGEIKVDHEQVGRNADVIARSKRNLS